MSHFFAVHITTKIQHLSYIGAWRQTNVGFRRQSDFNFQPKYDIW